MSRSLAAMFGLLATILTSCVTSPLGEARGRVVPLQPGNLTVQPRPDAAAAPDTSSTESAAIHGLLESWASRDLPDWRREGKVTAPRVLLARLALRRDVEPVNRYLLAQDPWGRVGSTWPLHPQGDYDFTELPLAALVCLYGHSDLLWPTTAAHVLEDLITQDGPVAATRVPRTLGVVPETENHILMTQGARYLKNQETSRRDSPDPRHDNQRNGLEPWLYRHLGNLEAAGLYEFNSNPYLGYTTMALLALEGFAESGRIRERARLLLDTMALHYAYGSLGFRRYPPFRRQVSRERETSLDADPHTALIKTWMALARPHRTDITVDKNTHQAVFAALMPYRLPSAALDLLEGRRRPYYVRFGRGPSASPEIYSGGPGYLLSAGGCGRGWRSGIVARPTVLLLDDGATKLEQTFHIPGERRFTRWNNTGVLDLFAVGPAPVAVPEDPPLAARYVYPGTDAWHGEAPAWAVYAPRAGPLIAVFSGPGVGILALFPVSVDRAEELARTLGLENPEPNRLAISFTRPTVPAADESAPFREVRYDTHARPGTWVIVSVDGQAVERRYDRWPRAWLGPPARAADGPAEG